jgi:signal transduction histidine kinase
MGLGLTISKEIINKYNGSIKFVSEYQRGSTFDFTFELEELERGGNQIQFDVN